MALALSAVRRNPLSVQYPQLNESALTCKVVKLNLLIENMEIELNIAALLKPRWLFFSVLPMEIIFQGR